MSTEPLNRNPERRPDWAALIVAGVLLILGIVVAWLCWPTVFERLTGVNEGHKLKPWGLLSGLLFAVAGSICMLISISLLAARHMP